jgi:predicted nucleotidyltransferase
VTDVLAQASVTPAEGRVLDRIVALAREEFGERLVSVWLYGSRARDESPHEESDVDVLIVADDPRAEKVGIGVDLAYAAADHDEEVSPAFLDVRVTTPTWLEGRRRIASFFIQEVDRDKIVLYGQP